MSNTATVAQHNQTYTGFDTANDIQYCTPSYMGCNVCIAATGTDNSITLTLALVTPFGKVSKDFTVNGPVHFDWQPFSKFKLTIDINNYSSAGGSFSFDLSLKLCVDVFGWHCVSYNHHFSKSGFSLTDNLSDDQLLALLQSSAPKEGSATS